MEGLLRQIRRRDLPVDMMGIVHAMVFLILLIHYRTKKN